MTIQRTPLPRLATPAATFPSAIEWLHRYFASGTRRTVQSILGVIWLMDGVLQLQSFMYGRGFVQMLVGMESGEPSWVAHSINWAAMSLQSHQLVLNTLFALVQIAIGVGLLYRRTVKPAITASFAWTLIVWWFGEAFGNLLMNTANPLSGAPGAVLLYAIIAAIVWPNDRPGGLIGVLGARVVWAVLWIGMGAIWLLPINSSAHATHDAISGAPSGASWLSGLQNSFAGLAKGNGLAIAIVLGVTSIVIGVGVVINWQPKAFLWVAMLLNLAYWVVPQGFGGIFVGNATDPNAAPLFILLAAALYALTPYPTVLSARVAIPRVHESDGDKPRLPARHGDLVLGLRSDGARARTGLALALLAVAVLSAPVPGLIGRESTQASAPATAHSIGGPAQIGPGSVTAGFRIAGYRIGLQLTPNRATVPGIVGLRVLAGNRPVSGARVRLTFSMPEMGGVTGVLLPAGPGRYAVPGPVLGMSGVWQLRLTVAPPRGKAFAFTVADQVGA